MLELNAAKYSRMLVSFATMERLMWQMSGIGTAPTLNRESADGTLKTLPELDETADAIGARFTVKSIRSLIDYIGQNDPLYAQILARHLSEIRQRLIDELELTKLFAVREYKALFFDSLDTFLDRRAQQLFPSAIFDADEAGKCLALSRHTACVFHTMRAAEAVVATLADKLGVTVRDQHGQMLAWGPLAANIGAGISKMPPGRGRDDWHQAQMFLVSCNRAFRTKTAHPVETYTDEQARDAYEATRAFIRSSTELMSP